jgi:hypothetical protein
MGDSVSTAGHDLSDNLSHLWTSHEKKDQDSPQFGSSEYISDAMKLKMFGLVTRAVA